MRITIEGKLPKAFIDKWTDTLNNEPVKVSWNELTHDLSRLQPVPDVSFWVQSGGSSVLLTRIGNSWYGSMRDDPNQQNIPLTPNDIPAFIGLTKKNEIDDEHNQLSPVLSKKRDFRRLAILGIVALVLSISLQISYLRSEKSDRREVPPYTPVSENRAVMNTIKGIYFAEQQAGSYCFEIRSNREVTLRVITATDPVLETYVDEEWNVTDIGSSGENFVLVLNGEEAILINPETKILDYYGDSFTKLEAE